MHLVSVLEDHAPHIPMLSVCEGGKDTGLIRWITSPSFVGEEGICDIILLMLTRKFLTHYISGGRLKLPIA